MVGNFIGQYGSTVGDWRSTWADPTEAEALGAVAQPAPTESDLSNHDGGTVRTLGWVIILLFAALSIVMWRLIPKSKRFGSAAELEPMFEQLTKAGSRTAHLFLLVAKGPESLQFHKDPMADGATAVSLMFPIVPWTTPYRTSIQELAAGFGFDVDIGAAAKGSEAIFVHCGTDTRQISDFAWAAIRDIYSATRRDLRAFTIS